MKSVMRAVDRFCDNHSGFGIPMLFHWIAGLSIVVFLMIQISPNYDVAGLLAFSPALILRGQVWRLLTWLFIPSIGFQPGMSNVFFFLVSLYFYLWLAKSIEAMWGRAKFNIFFFSGVILTVAYSFIAYALHSFGIWVSPVGFSIAPYNLFLTMFLVIAIHYPDTVIRLFFIIPIKMKWLAVVDLVLIAITVFVTPGPLRLLSVMNLLNVAVFCYPEISEYIRRVRGVSSFRRKAEWSVNTGGSRGFSSEVRSTQSFAERRCAVCGKPASEYPDMEFRYCSRCDGMHCFCEEHINSHVHIKE